MHSLSAFLLQIAILHLPLPLPLHLPCREEVQAGIRRRYEIVTHGIDVWHVLEYDHYKLPEPSHGQFHAGDTYVIRWNYSTLHTGMSSYQRSPCK